MKTLEEYEHLAAAAHGHLCAGQILGIRLATHAMELLGIDDPTGKDRKRLITFVEIDRCATDAIPVVTGCRLGKRALKFRDFGKVAATFCDLETGRAVRVVAKESSKQAAKKLYPEMSDKNQQQMRAYREMPAEDLFTVQHVHVPLAPEEFPGYRGAAHNCAECGESIHFERQLERDGRTLCKACAGERYYTVL